MRGAGATAPLVVDDADLGARLGQPQHGADDVVAPGAVQPRRADDDVPQAPRRHQPLALELRAPVDARRSDRANCPAGILPERTLKEGLCAAAGRLDFSDEGKS